MTSKDIEEAAILALKNYIQGSDVFLSISVTMTKNHFGTVIFTYMPKMIRRRIRLSGEFLYS